MKINVRAGLKIEKLLAEVQSRARERTITPRTVWEVAANVEAKLAALDIPKSKRAGVEVEYGRYSDFPNRYKYTPYATCIRLRRGAANWYLSECARIDCRGRNHIYLTDEQKKIVTQNALRDAARYYL